MSASRRSCSHRCRCSGPLGLSLSLSLRLNCSGVLLVAVLLALPVNAFAFTSVGRSPPSPLATRTHTNTCTGSGLQALRCRSDHNTLTRRTAIASLPLALILLQQTVSSNTFAAPADLAMPQQALWPIASLEVAAQLIQELCAPFIELVRRADGNLLYRGEKTGRGECLLCSPAPDLLQEGTYESSEAAEYFKLVEEGILAIDKTSIVRPTTCHLATPLASYAFNWGKPCSVWPIGPVQYAWLEHSAKWWDDGWTKEGGSLVNGNQGPFFYREPGAVQEFLASGLVMNSQFPVAVKLDHEIMFTTVLNDKIVTRVAAELGVSVDSLQPILRWGSYVAVPHDHDEQIRNMLEIEFKPAPNPREVFNDEGRVGLEPWIPEL